MTPDFYEDQLRPWLQSRPWILTVDALAGATTWVQHLLDAGASRPFVVAGVEGTGPTPPREAATAFVLGLAADTMIGGIRAFTAALADPPGELCRAIDDWDPSGEAAVLGNFLNTERDLCGRPMVGGRRPEWVALEDKLIASEIWDAAAVVAPPQAIVSASDRQAMTEALHRLSGPQGAVAVGDNREGWHGGGEYARYLGPGTDPTEAFEFFAAHCDRVRVTPFLVGVPCSIHGLVHDDGVMAFRPAEMHVFRQPGSNRFLYGALSNMWDPPPGVRDEMRAAVRRVGEVLRDRVEYRGAFGIDGVATADGFFPTELNPRYSGGLAIQGRASGHPLGDIDRAINAGVPLDLRPDDLEEAVVSAADATRVVHALTAIPGPHPADTITMPVRWDGHTWAETDEESAHGSLLHGPSAQGSLVMFRLGESHPFHPGKPFAPKVAAAFALADDTWDTRIGDLVAGWENL